MTPKRLRLRNLLYHWRGNAAVCLGVVVGTAVLTGALLVGDSLRGSLRDLALRRLGWVDQALVSGRFVRAELADQLPADRVAPALLLRGSAGLAPEAGAVAAARRVGRVTVLGVDARFWPQEDAPLGTSFWQADGSGPEGVVLNEPLARELGVSTGDTIALYLQQASSLPREALLGRRGGEDVLARLTVPVKAILPADSPAGDFSLEPSTETPRNAFVPLHLLQSRLGLAGRVNALLAAGDTNLEPALREHLDLEDWGLLLLGPHTRFDRLDRNGDKKLTRSEWRGRVPQPLAEQAKGGVLARQAVLDYYRQLGYLSLESRHLLIDPFLTRAAESAAKKAGLRAAPTLTYLANRIQHGERSIPYSIVAALDPSARPPLGPFLPPGVEHLADDEIVLADWKESPLKGLQPGSRVTLAYYPPVEEGAGPPRERTAVFTFRGFVPLTGPAADPDLTPEFPGITDKTALADWDPPTAFDRQDIQRRFKKPDEDYWKRYRTTPKAYVTLAAGQKLWGSRFGDLTSIRLAPPNGGSLEQAATAFRQALRGQLDPRQGGLAFEPVKARALAASAGGTDFEWLFLGFSFFLIVAALLLVGLLFRLNLERRAREAGLLFALGYRRRRVRRLYLGEGAVLAGVGAVLGSCAAMAYSLFLIRLMARLWPGGGLASFLRPHVTGASLVIGLAASLVVSVLTIAWAVRVLGRVPPRALLAGRASSEREPGLQRGSRWAWWACAGSAIGAVVLLACAPWVQGHEERAGTFFGSGALLLTACLTALWGWMRGTHHRMVDGHGWRSVGRLGVRNAARNPGRSLLTAGLLACAAFLVVAVEAFRREASGHEVAALNGGFTLLAESDVPLFLDLNTDKGRQEVLDRLRLLYQEQEKRDDARVEQRVRQAEGLLAQTEVISFRVQAGDDASCLNLYKPTRPRVLGVPDRLIERDGFAFAGTSAQPGPEKQNPWLILRRDEGPVPAFGEANTVVWMLKSGLGKEVRVPGGRGAEVPLRIDGLLQDSVFQSSLLISEGHFLKLYPHEEGYRFFLIRTPPGREEEVKELLAQGLADRGFEVTTTAERLQSYLKVENTYLSTFQALGGLGLILGSLGLAVVLLRGVWERRGELALLRALGYRRHTLGWLVLAENGFLLVVGLTAGTLSALLAVAPHLGGGEVPWPGLLTLLGVVLAVGLAAGALAVASTLRAPLVPALRHE